MVKGKQQAKAAQVKKNPAVKNELVPCSSPVAGSQKKPPSCCGCNKVIADDTKALQCDKCQSENWKCIECLSLSARMYDHLITEPSCNLCWFCDGCDRAVMEIEAKTAASSCMGNSDKIDKLVSVVEKLVDKLADVEDKLKDKGDLKSVEQLESRISKLEERLSRGETNLEKRLATIDEHVSRYVTDKIRALEESKTVHGQVASVEQAVKDEVGKHLEEDKEIEERRQNIIVYKVPEDVSADFTTRKDNDMKFITDMLFDVFHIGIQDGDIEKIFRLGRFCGDAEVARPLLVRFKDFSMKEKVMTNVVMLRQADSQFTSVNIAHDLTPKQREEIRTLITAARKEYVDGGNEDVENYRFVVVGQGPRRKVIKLRKQNSSHQQNQ